MSGDLAWGMVSLLLPGDGVDGSTVFWDKSFFKNVITPNGNVRISTNQSAFSGTSILFDGAGDYLAISHRSGLSADGDVTYEGWMTPSVANSPRVIFCKRPSTGFSSEFFLLLGSTGRLTFIAWNTLGTEVINLTGATAVSPNTRHHFAAVRSGSVIFLFLDGVLDASGTLSGAYASNTSPLFIGKDTQNDSRDWNGLLDGLRITKGLARYTSSFIPPAGPFEQAPGWFGAVRHGERASARPVATARRYVGAKPIPRSRTRADNSAGPGSILGTVKVDTLPVSRKVRLIDVASGRLLKETWSDTAGVYRFDGLALDRPYTVLSHDHQRDYNATVADYVYAEVLP